MPRPSVREQIVDAAYEQFHRHGYNAAGVKLITDSAGVPKGSFYNHFESKDDLFHAALEDALDTFGQVLDSHTGDLDDPAHVFAQSFRLTGRLHRRLPELSKVLLRNGFELTKSGKGLAPRARRDIDAAIAAGRFTVADSEMALVVVAGAVLALGQLLHAEPERDDARATDQIAEDLLRMLGVPPEEARDISRRPLPDVDASEIA